MKIKILAGEYLFSKLGTHICDVDGFATKSLKDTECDVDDEYADHVKSLIKEHRFNMGLDENGDLIVVEQ
jgi:hypothetical protein